MSLLPVNYVTQHWGLHQMPTDIIHIVWIEKKYIQETINFFLIKLTFLKFVYTQKLAVLQEIYTAS